MGYRYIDSIERTILSCASSNLKSVFGLIDIPPSKTSRKWANKVLMGEEDVDDAIWAVESAYLLSK